MSLHSHSPYDSITFGNSLLLRVDGAIGAMSLSPNGRDAVLAGRRGLFIIDLDDPFTTPRWLHHITSWEVADVQWSPHHNAKPSWCISTSNQKALLWDLSRPSNNAILNVLHQHTRAITDINFHPFDPELLATCSIDTFILSWDMRTPRRPVGQWAEWRAGATQVKWNHKNPYEIASSHDDSFYIWDSRKGALPVFKVNKAHNGKVNGLDFSNGISNIITCSNDKLIRFWDLSTNKARNLANEFNFFDSKNINSRSLDPSVIINTDFPVARARSLPFGKEKACGVMPLRGGQDSVHVVNYDNEFKAAKEANKTQIINSNPIHSFKGHNGPIKDFLWRKRHENYSGFERKRDWKDYQLVSWLSQDFDLKLWPHDEDLYKNVNYNPSYHKILDTLINEELDSEDLIKNKENLNIEDGKKFKNYRDNDHKEVFTYNTFCIEPPVTIDDLEKDHSGDILSSLVKYNLSQSYKQSNASQLNHLDWISGVRIGHSSNHENDGSVDEEDGPTNLGEEVSIVGHKFPKIRFEKISVSTGHLVMSLRGPKPIINSTDNGTNSTTNISSQSNGGGDGGGSLSSTNNAVSGGSLSVTAAPNTTISNNNTTASESVIEKEVKKDIKSEATTSANKLPSQYANSSNSVTAADDTNTSQNNTSMIQIGDEPQEQKLIFIRLEIIVPKNYPFLEHIDEISSLRKLAKLQKLNLIKFDIEETHELTSQIKKEMLKTLDEIARFYSNKYKRFCLEPCLRYLLGDKIGLSDSLMLENTRETSNDENIGEAEDYIQEIGTEGWADDLINQQPDDDFNIMKDDLSSEDEDDSDLLAINDNIANSTDLNECENVGFTEDHNNDVRSNITPDSAGPPNFDSTPIPKGCGAVWSHTGQLVCFFIPKSNEEDSKTLQQLNVFKFSEGGFTLKEQTSRHHRDDSDTSESDTDASDIDSNNDDRDNRSDSESITSSSSDDSFTNDWDEILQNDVPSRSRIPGLFKTSVGLGNRYISQGNKSSFNRAASQGGTTSNYKSSAQGGESNNKLSKKRSHRNNKKKNVVKIYDFRHLIPEKIELACEYRVLGDLPENLARYNSDVALRYGLNEISDVWKILEMVLIKDVRINDINNGLVSSQTGLKMQKNESMNELVQNSVIGKNLARDAGNNYRFYWGAHPLGHTWLIKEIVKYFELKGNIQMLAMLSCILFENASNIKRNANDLFNIPINTPYQVKPLLPSMMDLKEFTDDSNFFAFNNKHQTYTFHESFTSDPTPDIKPESHRNSSLSTNRLENNNASYPKSITSSMDYSGIPDSYSDRFSSFKKSIQPSNSLLPYSEISPPGDYNFTPRNQMFSRHNSNATVSNYSNFQNRKSSIQMYHGGPKKQKTIQQKKQQIANGFNKNRIRAPPSITVKMMNTDTLDLFDDAYTSALLDSQDNEKIKLYREQYAEMLFIWGLPINRIKILKFNYPNSEVSGSSHNQDDSPFNVHKFMFGFRKKSKSNQLEFSAQQSIDSPTKIQSSKHNAWNTNKRNALKYCSLCQLTVTKRVVVCTNCEHVLHADCAVEWWTTEYETDNHEQECCTGCGCNCLSHNL